MQRPVSISPHPILPAPLPPDLSSRAGAPISDRLALTYAARFSSLGT